MRFFSQISRTKLTGFGLLGSGATFLAQQTYDLFSLKSKLGQVSPGYLERKEQVIETEKKWLLFGRQSPGYVRDEKKTPKDHIVQIFKESVVLPSLGAIIDNEKHYDLFDDTDFVAEPITADPAAPKIVIKPEKMLSDDLDKIKDSDRFQLAIARKQGFADFTSHSPFYHSSIALRKIEGEANNSDAVVVTGKEVREAIEATNNKICKTQHCDLYSSNCYSATMYLAVELVEQISRRPNFSVADKKDMQLIASVISERAMDNFARGVSNNPVVLEKVTTKLPKTLRDCGILVATEAVATKESIFQSNFRK